MFMCHKTLFSFVVFFSHILKYKNQGYFLNVIKSIYEKLIANIILNGERGKDFPLRARQ